MEPSPPDADLDDLERDAANLRPHEIRALIAELRQRRRAAAEPATIPLAHANAPVLTIYRPPVEGEPD